MATREYLPSRFVASVPRHQAPRDALTGDSLNWLIRPVGEGTLESPRRHKAIRRKGQFTPGGWDTVLNTAWTGNKPRGRHIVGIRANQLTDKSQHPTALYTDDEGDKRGEVVTYDSDNTDWYSLGHEFHATHYPSTGFGGTGAADGSDRTNLHFRWTPMWTNGATTARYVRGITAADRQLMFAGGRANMEVGEWMFGMSDATPWMWRKEWNYATTSGTNINRLRPWGHQVPLFLPTIAAAGGTASVKSWRASQVVYYSCAFLFEDGSIGPFAPISDSVADLMPNGTRGRYTVPATSAYWEYIALTNLPRGGKGITGRVIARTAQVDSTSYQATFPGPNDLRIVTIIRNNTQTDYKDYQGDDETLIATPDLVRIDHKWPRRGKYLVANNSRYLMCGSLKPNPAAIIVAPTGITASRDLNNYGITFDTVKATDDADNQRADEYLASPGTRGFLAELLTSTFRMTYYNGSAAAVGTVFVNSGGSYFTLQQLVDLINQTTVASTGKEWAAQLAPGVDGDTLCNKLAFFTSSVASGDTARATAVGGAGSTPADQIWIRGPADPIVLYFSKAYMDTFPTKEQTVEWTRGGPSDTPSAILNWSSSKETERTAPDAFVGRCLGAAPMNDMFVVFHEHGIYRLLSSKEGNADEDMRFVPVVVGNIHVVADSSIFWGDGFAGCMTTQGVVVVYEDGTYEPISPGVYDSEEQRGEWLNEIDRSLKATQAGGRTTADDESFCYATVLSDQIHVSYRKTATAANDRRMVFDFSCESESKGREAIRAGRWGCPCTNTVGVMCEIADQLGGMVRYGVVENVAQGRIDKFDSGTTDNDVVVTATGYFATDFMDTLRLKQAEQLIALYAKNGTGLSLVLARDQGTSASVHGTDTYSASLASSGDDLYARTVIDLQPEARTPAEVLEVRIVDDGSGDPPEVWRVALSYAVTEFPR